MATQQPYIRFTNDRQFIQVRNTQTGVVVFMNKSSLLIQRDSSVSLLLKNDSYLGYYKYTDVEFPTTATIDELIDQLVTWVSEDPSTTSGADALLNIRNNYKASGELALVELASANASSSHGETSDALTEMTVTTDPGTRIVRQSREYLPTVFVEKVIVVAQARLSDGSGSDFVTSRVGVFEDQFDVSAVDNTTSGRGLFFEHDMSSGSTWAVFRSNVGGVQTDVRVLSEDWIVDPLDGQGSSGYTFDPTVTHLYSVEYDPLTERARLGLLEGGSMIYCHEFGRVGDKVPAMTMHAPVRWELTQTDPESTDGPSASATMQQGRATVFHPSTESSDGRSNPSVRSAYVGADKEVINTVGESRPIFSLRLKEEANRAKLAAVKLTVVNTSAGGVGRWELVENATFDAADTEFEDVDAEVSFAQFSSAETVASAGRVAASGFVMGTGVTLVDLESKGIYVSSNVAGAPETLTLRVTNVNGTLEILGGIEWIERE